MADLENATPFGASVFPSSDRDGRDLLLIVVGAQFVLPEPGDSGSRLELFDTQEPPGMTDEYTGVPGSSSLRYEGQSAYTKPATDICVWAEACAPRGDAVSEMLVSIRVGPCAVDMRVVGDRVWLNSVSVGATPSDARPFVRVPLVWERAYGGVASNSTARKPVYEPRNPVGCGLEADPDAAIGKPVPNIEDPRRPLRQLSDRPRPIGLTPVARHWEPRVSYAGTYDDEWRRERAPLWPLDLNERFFCCAPEYLQASPHLIGGEPVILQGLHPEGVVAFRLPTLRFAARSRFVDRTVRTSPRLDGIVIDTLLNKLTMYYRSVVPASRSIAKHYETMVRLMAPWEEAERS